MRKRIFPHLAILFALAVAQPLYQLIGEQPGFLAAHGFDTWGLLWLTMALSAGLPWLAWLLWRSAGTLSRHLADAVLALMVAVLCTLILLPVFGNPDRGLLSLPPAAALVLSLAGGLALAAVYFRSRVFRLFLTVFSLAAVVFPLNFLFLSPATQLMLPGPSGIGGDRLTLQRKPPVVFLLFDEFPLVSILDRTGAIDQGRFPNLAALQQDALWFPRHTVNSNSTLISVPSLLSGHLPFGRYQGLPRLENYPDNVFVLLGGHYDMNVREHGSQLCPEQFCGEYRPPDIRQVLVDLWILLQHLWAPQEWARHLPAVDNDWMNFGVTPPPLTEQIASLKAQLGWHRRVEAFDSFVASLGEQPEGFHYIHAMLPHGAWQYLPDGRVFTMEPTSRPIGIRPGENAEGDKHVWYEHPDAARLSRQAHVLQTGFVDHLVGQVVHRLREIGMYDRSLIVLTSDHGAAFTPGRSRRSLGDAELPETAGVPLLIKFPGSAHSGASDLPSQGIDIVPTLLAYLGAEGWTDFEGVDLLSNPPIGRRPLRLLSEDSRSAEMNPAQYADQLAATTKRYTRRDGDGDYVSLYHSGDRRGLVGTSLSELETRTDPVATLEWDLPDTLRNNRPDAPVLQLVASGVLAGDDWSSREIAISVNGTIQAVSRVFDFPGQENRFAMLLPPGAFTPNADRLEAWLVEDGSEGPALTAIPSRQIRHFELITAEDATVLRSGGRDYLVERGVVPGWSTARKGRAEGLWIIGGWAASLADREPAESLMLFVDGEFALARAPDKETDTVARRFHMEEIRYSAFDLPLVPTPGKALEELEVRVFALSRGGRVSEINYPQDPALWPFRPNPRPTGPAIAPYE